MTYPSEWKKVLRTVRYKAYEILGMDDFDVFQELCKVTEERFTDDPITKFLVRIMDDYSQGKAFYLNNEIVDAKEVTDGVKYNTYLGETYRKAVYKIIEKILDNNYDLALSLISKEVPMINKRAKQSTRDAVIENYEDYKTNSNLDDEFVSSLEEIEGITDNLDDLPVTKPKSRRSRKSKKHNIDYYDKDDEIKDDEVNDED